MGDLTVRALDRGDVAVLAAREPASRGYARSAWERQQLGEVEVLVAWCGEVPVGSGEVTAGPRPELRNLAVDERFRGRGIGTRIIAAAEERARGRGLLRVGVAVDNPGARRLYERLGYVATGAFEVDEYTWVDDADQAVTERETSEYLEKSLV